MTAPTTTAALLDRAVESALWHYRVNRQHGRQLPYDAANSSLLRAARLLAERVLTGEPIEFDLECYRAAKAVHDAVDHRAAVGVTWDQKNRQQQFWTMGEVSS